MKYTICASAADNTAPLVVSTEDPAEALESVLSFSQAQMTAHVVDEKGKAVDLAEIRQAAERPASG